MFRLSSAPIAPHPASRLAFRLAPWLTLMALIAQPGTVHSQSVVNVLPATSGAWGLDYRDGYLWVGDDGDGFLRQVDPADGSVIATLPTPYDQNHISSGANHGVAWDGSGLWVAGDYGKDWLYKVGPTGAFLDTIPTPTDAVGGLSWDGTYLIVTSYYPNGSAGILRVDPADGSIVGSTIPTQGAQPYGIAYDGTDGTVWNGMDDIDGDPEKIWHLGYPAGSVISSFDSPAPSPKGIALGGGYLWLVANNTTGSGRRIYQIDLAGAGTPDIAATPTQHSFGIVPLGSSGSHTQFIQNVGDGDLIITGITTAPPFSFDGQTFPLTVAPDQTISFGVHFAPVVAGNHQGILRIESNDFDEGVLDLPLTGIGVYPEATINLSPPTLNFPDTAVGFVTGRTLTIENVGFDDLVVTDLASDDPRFEIDMRAVELPVSLATFQTLEAMIVFRPPATGAAEGTITVSSTDPDDPTVVAPASGNGIVASFDPGEPIWSAQGIENVVDVLPILDITSDGIMDAVMESYDAGADGDPHQAFHGNSFGSGVRIWSRGAGTSGGYGDQCLARIGDLDGDGFEDIVRGVAWGGRRVETRSSFDGSLIWQFDTTVNDGGGWVYSVTGMPDLSGDGIPEVVAGAGTDGGPGTGARRLYCFDGATGSVRFNTISPDAFLSAAWIEDVNGDGIPDVLGGAGGNGADDRVYCVSGASSGVGTLIWSFSTGGSVWSLDVIDDVTGDGIDDVIAGSWSGNIFCVNGATGSQVWARPIGGESLRVEAIDDVTGDGVQDVIAAQLGTGFRCINGATGAIHWLYPTGGNVWSVSAIADLDQDGRPDVLAGSQNGNVTCVSGATGALIWQRNLGALVLTVRAIPDVSGNGAPDVLAGTQLLNGTGGLIWCLEGGAPTVDVGDPAGTGPSVVRVLGPRPNPMRRTGEFVVDVGRGVEGAFAVEIFDVSGRRLRTLEQQLAPGLNRIGWDGRSADGRDLPDGVYLYRMQRPGGGLPTDEPAIGETRGKFTLLR